MTDDLISFDDGAAYERMMGVWSRLVGEEFLTWLAHPQGLRWIDVGCGNGAFTALLAERCAPASILGVDPSEGQLRFASARPHAGEARFQSGAAVPLPAETDAFDAAVMALVLFFTPDPAGAVEEMRRVTRPGGLIAAYVWDLLEPGGFPMRPLQEELLAHGVAPVLPPSAEVSRDTALRSVWEGAGLVDVRTRAITVRRTFESFDVFWSTVEIALGMAPASRALASDTRAAVREGLRARLAGGGEGPVSYTSRANAVAGRVSG